MKFMRNVNNICVQPEFHPIFDDINRSLLPYYLFITEPFIMAVVNKKLGEDRLDWDRWRSNNAIKY